MALPVSVTLDRGGLGALDLTPLIDADTLTWSSVVPGGFASCSFQLRGDPRQLIKQVLYLSIVRVIGDSGAVLFEGQVEDLAPTVSADSAGVKVGAFGLQNILTETTTRNIWSKRDMAWGNLSTPTGTAWPGTTEVNNPNFSVQTGQFDATNLARSGVQVGCNGGVSIPNHNGGYAEWRPPISIGITTWLGTYATSGTDSGTNKVLVEWWYLQSGTWTNTNTASAVGPADFTVTGGMTAPTALRVGFSNVSGAPVTLAANDLAQFYNMRVLGVLSTEDVNGGFYGDTLLRSLVGVTSLLSPGVLESGSDFTIEHLDASTHRTLLDLVNEVAAYYSREWAVWENATFNWTTPNLAQHQWIIPIAQLSGLDLDASTQNSQNIVLVDFTDAASGLQGAAQSVATDRRNPYVLNNHFKSRIVTPGFSMTTNTATQLAAKLMQDLGYGPVPAAGSISLPGDTIVQHAQGNAKKAWEIRAGDNVTIPELPLVDVFTQDGRGECLFHIISAEANIAGGTVTLTLDSYGSKRSDVLLARLAAVTQSLGG